LESDSPHSASSSFEIVLKHTETSPNSFYLSKDSEEHETPVSLALKNGCWKVFGIFSELGAAIPKNLGLEPMLEKAVKDLDGNTVRILIAHGVHPTERLVLTLVESLSSTVSAEPAGQDISAPKFQDVFPALMSAKANVNYVDPESKLTPLVTAAKMRISAQVICELLNSGADAYYGCSRFFDPILTAAICGNEEGLRCLMEHVSGCPKADHWSKYLSTMILQDADSIDVVCSCLERAGQLDRVNSQGQTVLHLAAEGGNCQLIKSLLLHNANSGVEDSQGWLPLHYAGFSDHADAVECLLPLEYTSQNFERLKVPLENKPQRRDILEKKNKSGETMFQQAVKGNNVPMVSHLLKLGADIKSEIEHRGEKEPPLYYAANRGHEELSFVLLSHGASVEVSDRYGWQPLHTASYNGHISIVKALIASGAEVCAATTKWNNNHVKPSGIYAGDTWTGHPLHLAAMCGYIAIVRFLLQHGADVQASTGRSERYYPGHGPTALHVVLDTGTFYGRPGAPLDKGRLEIAQMLVDRGAGVEGVADTFSLREVLKFKEFPALWDVLRAGITARPHLTV
jgi:ankyrin repeat protein